MFYFPRFGTVCLKFMRCHVRTVTFTVTWSAARDKITVAVIQLY